MEEVHIFTMGSGVWNGGMMNGMCLHGGISPMVALF
ncbi:MAG: hypothetical protein CM15mP22_6920 [Gammaproteobacteria bacterium]|nr:MAG: hypothetical protein CM15mP22_6920 [Gammaproteobacteria bacterium]